MPRVPGPVHRRLERRRRPQHPHRGRPPHRERARPTTRSATTSAASTARSSCSPRPAPASPASSGSCPWRSSSLAIGGAGRRVPALAQPLATDGHRRGPRPGRARHWRPVTSPATRSGRPSRPRCPRRARGGARLPAPVARRPRPRARRRATSTTSTTAPSTTTTPPAPPRSCAPSRRAERAFAGPTPAVVDPAAVVAVGAVVLVAVARRRAGDAGVGPTRSSGLTGLDVAAASSRVGRLLRRSSARATPTTRCRATPRSSTRCPSNVGALTFRGWLQVRDVRHRPTGSPTSTPPSSSHPTRPPRTSSGPAADPVPATRPVRWPTWPASTATIPSDEERALADQFAPRDRRTARSTPASAATSAGSIAAGRRAPVLPQRARRRRRQRHGQRLPRLAARPEPASPTRPGPARRRPRRPTRS